MKIAVITASTSSIPRFRIDMIREFIQRECQVVVFGDEPFEKWDEYFSKHGISYRQYSVARNGVNPVKDLETIKQLRLLLETEHPDKIFTYQAKPNVYGVLAAHQIGIKEKYVMMGGLGSVFRSRGPKSFLIRQIVGAEYKFSLNFAKKIFFQNKEDMKLCISKGMIRNNQVVMTRGSGVNLDQYPLCPLPKKDSFLFVGRLVRGKGIIDYLEAAKIIKRKYPDIEFHVVGAFDSNPTGIKREELDSYINNAIVIYHGEQENVQPYLKDCSCFVLPSYYGEGTPKSALEAMATGRPLIVADAVGCREVVKNGVNGFLVKPKSPEEIVLAMERLIEDKDLKQRMSDASRAIAETLFDVRKVNKTICDAMEIIS